MRRCGGAPFAEADPRVLPQSDSSPRYGMRRVFNACVNALLTADRTPASGSRLRLTSMVMSEPPDELRRAFQGLLNLALTRGRATPPCCDLGPGTRAAIDRVAGEHPESDADSIVAAYDEFQREHGERPTAD
jgi:hypothetical protein